MWKSFPRGAGGGAAGPLGLPASVLAIWGAVLLVVVIAYRDVWPWLLTEWRDNPYYSHGILVPLLSLFLIWHRRAALAKRSSSNWGYALVGVGVVMLVIG